MKKRFEVLDNGKNFITIKENSKADFFITEDNIEDFLNEQFKEIKELQEEIKKWKKYLAQSEENRKFEQEKKNIAWARVGELKQTQNSKAIEVLDKVKEYCENWKQYADYYNYVLLEETGGVRTIQTLYEFINNQITELIGGK